MIHLRDDVIEMLRRMARRGERPSTMLRAAIAELGPEMADRPMLIWYFMTAFCFTNGQAFKIAGWFPDGTERLKDSDIDALLSGRIRETRAEWDRPVSENIELDLHLSS